MIVSHGVPGEAAGSEGYASAAGPLRFGAWRSGGLEGWEAERLGV